MARLERIGTVFTVEKKTNLLGATVCMDPFFFQPSIESMSICLR